jgi:hypothetical protein
VGAPGGKDGNLQSRARTISLHCCSTSGGITHRGPIVVVVVVEKKKKKKKKKKGSARV